MYMKMYKNLSAKYYQENKERLHTHTHTKKETDVKDIKIFLRKKKKKKQQYGCESYKNLCEYENNKLVQHRKKNIIK